MAVDLDKIELGAGALIIYHFVDNTNVFWDSFTWDSGWYWPDEWEVGAMLDATFGGKKIYKDISIGAVMAAVKSGVIGAEGEMKVKMMESSMANLIIAMGGDPEDVTTDATSEKYVFGGSAKSVIFGLKYEVPHLEDATKVDTLIVYRGVPVDMSPIIFSKTEERGFEVTFKLLGEKTRQWNLGDFSIEK